MGFMAPIGAAFMELLPAFGAAGAGAGAAGAGTGLAGTMGAAATGLELGGAAAGLSPGFASMMPALSLAGEGAAAASPMAAMAPSLAGSLGPTANLALGAAAPPSMATTDPLVSALKSTYGVLSDQQKIAAMGRSNSSSAYMHPGQAVPVKVGQPAARKISPLEQFAMLLKARG